MKVTALIIGTIAGLVGAFHGLLEILHGNIAPSGIVINALKGGQVPMVAMTIIPNFLVTGILALIVGIVILIWVAGFVQRKNGGLILILLSILLLLVGGGFAPPGLGILSGIIRISIKKPA
jgi:hypothetical protein